MPPTRASQRAQAVMEFLVAWPILLLALCLILQLCLIWWAQQTLAIATQYAVRAGAVNHGSQQHMEMTLAAVMAGVRPKQVMIGEQQDALSTLASATASVAQQRVHLALYGKLERVSPSQQQLDRFADYRWDPVSGRRVKEIAVDHYLARKEQQKDEDWVQARRLIIDTTWCYNLTIPLAAELLGWLAQQRGQCALGNQLSQVSQWPLKSHAEHELLSGFRVSP